LERKKSFDIPRKSFASVSDFRFEITLTPALSQSTGRGSTGPAVRNRFRYLANSPVSFALGGPTYSNPAVIRAFPASLCMPGIVALPPREAEIPAGRQVRHSGDRLLCAIIAG